MPGDENAVGTETSEEKPTTSNESTTEDQTPRSDESPAHPQKRVKTGQPTSSSSCSLFFLQQNPKITHSSISLHLSHYFRVV
ncbi:hypothetical protein CRE_29531 [Caenorhabditis remanei]|uniref:Uncharacterized protein n=1 Tax=Caenorhabditis remanei TaxID=31234 RepID=E3LVI4_CAERE|nr:hypothetical protein CRE_29531 [Caenorhabditis remanei]